MSSRAMQGGGGLFLPLPVVVTLLLAAAGVGAAYIFATKLELANVAQEANSRITVVEEKSKVHDSTLIELKSTIKDMDQNVRTLMIEQGVPKTKIKGESR